MTDCLNCTMGEIRCYECLDCEEQRKLDREFFDILIRRQSHGFN